MFSSGGIPPPQIPHFLLSSRGNLSIFATILHHQLFFDDLQRNFKNLFFFVVAVALLASFVYNLLDSFWQVLPKTGGDTKLIQNNFYLTN